MAHLDNPMHKGGSIFAFLPAHSGSRTGAVARHLGRTLAEGLGVTVLLADFDQGAASASLAERAAETSPWPDARTWRSCVSEVDSVRVLNAREVKPRPLRRLLDYAREHVHMICADLSAAGEAQALEVVRAADAVFLVTGSDVASLKGIREKMDWLRSSAPDSVDQCGLLLEHTPHGVSAAEAEERTGVPVCGFVDSASHVVQLATWLAVNALEPRRSIAELAEAV